MIIREAQDERIEEPCPADVFNAEPTILSGSRSRKRLRVSDVDLLIEARTFGSDPRSEWRRPHRSIVRTALAAHGILVHTPEVTQVAPACTAGSAFRACAVYAFSVSSAL